MTARRVTIAALALSAAAIAGIITGGCSATNRPQGSGQIGPMPSPTISIPSPTPSVTPSAVPSATPTPTPSEPTGTLDGGGPTAPDPGRLVLDRSTLRLGPTYSGVLTLRNAGGSDLAWRATPSTSGLVVSPNSGTLRYGTVRVTVTAIGVPDGALSAHITFAAGATTHRVTITGQIETDPVVSGLHTIDEVFCVGGTTQARATVVDGQGVASVTLTYYFINGTSFYRVGDVAMTRVGTTNTYVAPLGPFPGPGVATYSVGARDLDGNPSNAVSSQGPMDNC